MDQIEREAVAHLAKIAVHLRAIRTLLAILVGVSIGFPLIEVVM